MDLLCFRYAKRESDDRLEVDHVVPVCKGGTNDPSNLVAACFRCNRGKAGLLYQGQEWSVIREELKGYQAEDPWHDAVEDYLRGRSEVTVWDV